MSPIRLRIAEFRQANSWSQSELARRSGVPQATIWRLENDPPGVVNLKHLEGLAGAFGVHPRELLLQEPE